MIQIRMMEAITYRMTRQLILATAITLQIRISLRILSLSAALREKNFVPNCRF